MPAASKIFVFQGVIMSQDQFSIDDSRMPVRLGSALRVPSPAYRQWGIEKDAYRPDSERQYETEWAGGSPKQMEYVVRAITETGLGNFSQMLRDANANVVSGLIRGMKGRVNYLEPGAGVSTEHLVDRLLADGVDMDRVHMTLIEPSEERLERTAENLGKKSLVRGKHFNAYPGKKDTDALAIVGPWTQDIVSHVAELHHHSYLDAPMHTLASTIKEGGYFCSSDWHNSMWMHPNRVYRFLQNMEWETKERDLAAYRRAYPRAVESAPTRNEDLEANRMIMEFWKGWARVRAEAIGRNEFDPRDDIFMLEGHRPVGHYQSEAQRAGLFKIAPDHPLRRDGTLPENPYKLVKGSSILNALVMRKIA